MDAARFYENMYTHTNYSVGIGDDRTEALKNMATACMRQYQIGDSAVVLEVGAGHGDLRRIHPNWHGVEYSEAAISQGNAKHGASATYKQGDATRLEWADNIVDFLYTFATLEHVPEIEKALQEIMRVLRPGGVALVAPAWNCRPWTVQKLQQRPYDELGLFEKVGKALIPLRENLIFRSLLSLPGRIYRECLMRAKVTVPLQYRAMTPRWDLMDKYPHIADDDAFVSMDAHAAMAYFLARGFAVPSHGSLLRRLACRGEPIVVVKPA